MMGSGWRSGGQHQQANYCHRAVIYPSRPSRHGSSCPTGASAPEVTKAWLVGLGRSPVSDLIDECEPTTVDLSDPRRPPCTSSMRARVASAVPVTDRCPAGEGQRVRLLTVPPGATAANSC